MKYSWGESKLLSVTHTLPDGKKERICTIPSSHLSKFRNKMLEIESQYYAGKKKHYTEHTKNAELAKLEAARDYLKQTENKIASITQLLQKLKNEKRSERLNIELELDRLDKKSDKLLKTISKIVEIRKNIGECSKENDRVLAERVREFGLDEEYDPKLTELRKFGAIVGDETIELNISAMELQIKELVELNKHVADEIVALLIPQIESIQVLNKEARIEILVNSVETDVLDECPKNLQDSIVIFESVEKEKLAEFASWHKKAGEQLLENIDAQIQELINDCKKGNGRVEKTVGDFVKILKKSNIREPEKKGFRPKKINTKDAQREIADIFKEINSGCRRYSEIIKVLKDYVEYRNSYFGSILNQINLIPQSRDCIKRRQECQKKIESISALEERYESILDIANKRLSSIRFSIEKIEVETKSLKNVFRQKNLARNLHEQNSPRTREDGPIIDEFKKEYIAPEIGIEETTQEEYLEIISNSINKLAEQIWSHNEFEGFCNNDNLRLKPRFRRKIRDLAKIYIEKGGNADIERMQAIFSMSMKQENSHAARNSSKEFRIMRIAFANKKKYRFLVGVKEANRPIVYFVGESDESHNYMENARYKEDFHKALKDGRADIFSDTLTPAIKAFEKLREQDPNFSLFN